MPTLHLGLLSISLSGLDHIQGRCKLSKEKQTYLGGVCEGTPQVTQEHGTVLLLIRRFAGNVGNPLQTKHGNRPFCRDQEG